MNLYDSTIPLFSKMLSNLERWLDKAATDAAQRKFDPEILVSARLAPDQFPLLQQIQSACDATKYAAAKLAGKEAPSIPDTEKTLGELRARIATARAYLETFKREEFAGAEDRPCTHVWMEGKHLRGRDYVDHLVLPNLYFHLTTAYAILRHNGVPLGKEDFLGSLPLR
jgi:hypothetical protein